MKTLRNSWLEEDDEHLLRECVQDFHKASGNGGQKVNKTSSAVRLIHTPSGVSVSESGDRSQVRNRSNALKKLRLRIAMTVRCKIDEDCPVADPFYVPSVHNIHAYAPWLAVLVDHLAFDGWDVRRTAERYGISSSRLIKIIFRDSDLWQELNRKRAAAGLASLKGIK